MTQYGEHSLRLLGGVISTTTRDSTVTVTKLAFANASKIRNLKKHIPQTECIEWSTLISWQAEEIGGPACNLKYFL